MGGVTAIQNPLQPGQILLFYNTNTSELALLQKEVNKKPNSFDRVDAPSSLTEHQSFRSTPAAPNAENGIVGYGTSLTSLRYNNLLNVYGVRWTNEIYLLSPVQRPVSEEKTLITNSGSVAVTGDERGAGWLYYLRDSPQRIAEFGFEFSSSVEIEGIPSPIANSYLAAFYDYNNDFRNVVYQASNGIHVTSIKADASDIVIQSTETAKKNTPLAVTSIKTDNGTLVYLYYANSVDRLQRVVRDASGKWGQSTAPPGAAKLESWTQLTVTSDVERGVNHVFYIEHNGSGKFVDFADKF